LTPVPCECYSIKISAATSSPKKVHVFFFISNFPISQIGQEFKMMVGYYFLAAHVWLYIIYLFQL